MRWSRYEPLGSPTHALDPLRNRIAELGADGLPEGLISMWVETEWDESSGSLWWKTWMSPHEVLAYEISWFGKDDDYLFDDGVARSEDVMVEELLAGTVTLYGDTHEIRWLDGDEFADAKIVMGVADLWTAVSDPVGDDLIVDVDIERLLRRVATDVFNDDIGAVHSGDPQTAEANLVNAATVAGENPRRAQLRLTHDWIGLTLTDLDVGTVLFDYDEYDEHEMEAALKELAQVAQAYLRGEGLVEFKRGLFRTRPVYTVSVNDREWKMGRHGSSTSYP